MVQGLKFLSKKGFHPQNFANKKRVWEAEQEGKIQEQRAREREAQLRRERDDEELAQARGDLPKLGFVYQPPPGLEHSNANPNQKEEGESKSQLLDRRPGDDDAAAAFRRMLAGVETENSSRALNDSGEQLRDTTQTSAFGSTVLQGSAVDAADIKKQNTALTALEQAVGRKKERANSSFLTLDEQIQRFPALANAPRAKGMTATDVGVRFNPLGTQIRNVKCLACGIWGHSRGDRECSKSGWDPFSSTSRQSAATTAENEHGSTAGMRASSTVEELQHEEEMRRARSDDDSRRKRRKREGSRDRKRRSDDSTGDDDSSSSSSETSSSTSDDSHRHRRKRHRSDSSSDSQSHKERRRKRHGKSSRRRSHKEKSHRRHRSKSTSSRREREKSRNGRKL